MNDVERIDNYRKFNKRCRTCCFAYQKTYEWLCTAKSVTHIGDVTDTHLRGMFCKLYSPRKFR